MIEASAPGNVFLLGEHSVVYERPALLASIGKRTYVKVEKRNDEKILIDSEGYGEIQSSLQELQEMNYHSHEEYVNPMDPLRDLIGYFSREIKEMEIGFEADITSDIPRDSGGQSSSTAVLSAFLKFLSEIYGAEVPKEDYFEHLYPFQVKIHGGAASGSELTSSVFGGYNHVVKTPDGDKPVKFENLGNLELDLVIGDTGIEAKTSETVSQVRGCWEEDREAYEEIFDEIAGLVQDAEDTISRGGDLKELGDLMNRNQELLQILDVSHPKLEKLIEAARDAGAYGAKLSGGGGGGIMVALCDEDNRQRAAESIEETGGKAAVTEVGVEGVRKEN